MAFIKAVAVADLSALQSSGGVTRLTGNSIGIYITLIAALFVFALATSRKAPGPPHPARNKPGKREVSKHGAATAVMVLLLIPLTILFGLYGLGGKKYYFIALLILLEAMLPFFLIFEDKKPQARELVIIAALCAMTVDFSEMLLLA